MKDNPSAVQNLTAIKWLTFLMFMMFAMTTDSVGVIIPEVIREFHLSMTVGGAFHYAAMSGIAVAAFFLGYLADKLGRKRTIILGLVLFALNSYLFAIGRSFVFFIVLLTISGAAIGIFKTGALALIGDISTSTTQHTATMNAVEGFFAVGAIIGPAIVTHFLAVGISWKWLYVIAGSICVILIVISSSVRYPQTTTSTEGVDLRRTVLMMEESLRSRVFGSDIPVCGGRKRNLCMDAYAPRRLPRPGDLDGGLRNLNLLRSSRSGKIYWLMDAREVELGRGYNRIQPGNIRLFHRERDRRNWHRRIPFALVRFVHVCSLSHNQLQRHKLLPQDRTWCGGRRDSVLHLPVGSLGPTCNGRDQRRLRGSEGRIYSRHGFCGCSLYRTAAQLDFQSNATTSTEARCHGISGSSRLGHNVQPQR